MDKHLRLVAPSFTVATDVLQSRVEQLRSAGFRVFAVEPFADDIATRSKSLVDALCDRHCDNVLCVRGGYGASDLLPHIPYQRLSPPKRLIGYSDISAISSALWTQRQFVSINAPMPVADGWQDNDSSVMQILFAIMRGELKSGQIVIDRQVAEPRQGPLFGGCFSVLTNLIGTSYFPRSLAGYILFFEDIGENIGRLVRYLNQWQYSGMLRGVQAMVLGRFDGLSAGMGQLTQEFSERVACPVYRTEEFGHSEPLSPLPVGGYGQLSENKLRWQI